MKKRVVAAVVLPVLLCACVSMVTACDEETNSDEEKISGYCAYLE